MLTEAQVKLAGPLQPAGKALNPAVIDRFVAVAPSSVVNVTLSAAPDPTTTSMAPFGEGVATILLFVGVDEVGNWEEDTPYPQAAKIAKLAAAAQRLSSFRVFTHLF